MVGVNVFAADTDAEARRLITSLQQQFVSLRRGTPDLYRRRSTTWMTSGRRWSGRV
jgi:alkanesulfonate monooxygenase SsuD/methylene tetrahydromethanopterin reductase-like flavin-dependent oxidoreductase (luciferase family)